MKSRNKFFFLFILSGVLLLTACRKSHHRICFHNGYNEKVKNVKIGSSEIGDVEKNETSDFVDIPPGEHKVEGNTSTQFIDGKVTISGRGNHLWTLYLGKDGRLTVEED